MKRRISTRVLSMFMALLMLAMLIPTAAFSASAEEAHTHKHISADVWDGSVASVFDGGDGGASNPYLITTAAQLAYLAQSTNGGNTYSGVHFKLMNNIDLNGILWTPIGKNSYGFKGHFDGNGKAIFGLSIDVKNLTKAGFFAYMSGGSVKSLAIVGADVSIYDTTDAVKGGILCGNAIGVTFEECYINGDLSVINERSLGGKSARAGLIIGQADGNTNIKNCYAVGSSYGEHTPDFNAYVGGLVGFSTNNGNNIENSYFNGEVYSVGNEQAFAAGIIGTAYSSSNTMNISNSFVFGKISGIAPTVNVDALVSSWGATIKCSNSYYAADVFANHYSKTSKYGSSVEAEKFSDASWISETLLWDMSVWTVDPSAEYPYPTLNCFAGLQTPPVIDTPDIPEIPEEPEVDIEADVWDGSVATSFGGGKGSESDPYLIYTAAELAYLAEFANNGYTNRDMHFKLMNNIDLNGLQWTPIGGANSKSWEITSNMTDAFRGIFDGNGYSVINLKMSAENIDFVGLFGTLVYATVKNLAVRNADIEARYTANVGYLRLGVLAGGAYNSTVDNCMTSGRAYGECSYSYASIGGSIVAAVQEGVTIRNTYSTVDIEVKGDSKSYNAYVGGLVGWVLAGGNLIERSYFAGSVTTTLDNKNIPFAGGLVGTGEGYITVALSFSVGTLNAYGTNGKSDPLFCTWGGYRPYEVYQCYVYKNAYVNGAQQTPDYGTVIDDISYFTSEDTLRDVLTWDMDSVWTVDADANYPYPTLRVIKGATSQTPPVTEPEEPDIPEVPDEPEIDIEADVWDGSVATAFGGGTGTEDDPYLIYTASQLAFLAQSTNSGNTYSGVYFKLMNNIDLAGLAWTPIGLTNSTSYSYYTGAFSGNFDGNGKTVLNLYVDTQDVIFGGFFARLQNATVTRLAIVGAKVNVYNTLAPAAGGILCGGASNVTISQCYVDGELTVTNKRSSGDRSANAGLFAGLVTSNIRLTDCYATGTCTGITKSTWNVYIGGLIGCDIDGSANVYIESSYFNGDVIAEAAQEAYAAGLFGLRWGNGSSVNIKNSFAIGSVSAKASSASYARVDAISLSTSGTASASGCYYNMSLSKQGSAASSALGNSTEIQDFTSKALIFKTLGWDMDVWTIDASAEYPYPTLKCLENVQTPPVVEPEDPEINTPADVWDGSVATSFGGGTGTEDDPYLIYTASQLAFLAQSTNAGNTYSGVYFKLMNDIDLAGLAWTPIGLCATSNYSDWRADGFTGGGFSGNLDGCGFTVSNLSINRGFASSAHGLFGLLKDATVKDIVIRNANVKVTTQSVERYYNGVGSLAGIMMSSEVSGVYADAIVYTDVYAYSMAGIIVGIMDGNSKVTNCYTSGNATSSSLAGGIAGAIFSSAHNGSEISNCYSKANADTTGGGMGSDCSAGGITPYTDKGSIYNCVFIGTLKGNGKTLPIGESRAKQNNCYYSYGASNNFDISSFTTEEFLRDTLGWDMDVWTVDADAAYPYPTLKYIGAGKPTLPENPEEPDIPEVPDEPEINDPADIWDGSIATEFGGGTGTEDDPYLIYTAAQLAYLAQRTNNGNNFSGVYFKLMSDIDLAGIAWESIGASEYTKKEYSQRYTFSGNFDGNHKKIYNLNVAYSVYSFTGLFGCLYDATVLDLAIVDANVKFEKSTSYRVTAGILAGASYQTTIRGCYVTGKMDITISAATYINAGALIGNFYNSCAEDCFAKADINIYSMANGYVGGLFGYANESFAQNLLFIGDITQSAGGSGVVNKAALCGVCKSSSANNLYYSSDMSSTIGTYLSSAELGEVTSFIGFDFENVWEMVGSEPALRGFGFEAVLPHVHEYVQTVTSEPTCTTAGSSTAECRGCGDKIVSYIPAKGHSYVAEVTKEATCTEAGIITYTCVNCKDSYTIETHSQHNYELEVIPASCTEDGAMVYTCSKCQDVYRNVITAGHNYEAHITKVATRDEDGEITYICSLCKDSYTEVIPATDASVLLVQDKFPWNNDSASKLLDKLVEDGRISGWTLTTTDKLDSVDLSQYSAIYIANDQTTATYDRLAKMNDALVEFANAGGVVIYGACDRGWAGGSISGSLLGGVEKIQNYSTYNYIVDKYHSIVTGSMTDDKALTNSLLSGNYCSHTSFNINTLPAGYNVILQDGNGNPTLVEYPMGDGYVILSGLTWEYYYSYGSSYSTNVFDDLIIYALSLSDLEACDHVYDESSSVIVEATCGTEGYTLYVCLNCGYNHKENYVSALGHSFTNEIVDDKYFAHGADCENAARYYYSCDCGEHGNDTFTYGDPAGHNYVENPDDKYLHSNVSCTEYATYYESCDVCGKQGEKTFVYGEPFGHHYIAEASDKYIVSNATCTESAIYHSHCSRCGELGNTFGYGTTAAHNYVESAEDKYLCTPASCTESATYYSHCSECGAFGNVFVYGASAGHNYVQDADDKYLYSEANCSESAKYFESCSECGEQGSNLFDWGAPAGHDYVENPDDKFLYSSATETDSAVYYSSCEGCGETGYWTFYWGEPAGHDYVENPDDKYLYSEATETESAKYYASCSRCGELGGWIFSYGAPLGHVHNFVERVEDRYLCTEATCMDYATYYASCEGCGQIGDWTFYWGDYAEHDYVDNPDSEYLVIEQSCIDAALYYSSCSYCGCRGDFFIYGEPLGHDYIEKPYDEYLFSRATCTESAVYYSFCTRCGEIGHTYSYGKPLGHNFEEIIDDYYIYEWPTCTERAEYAVYCSHCGEFGYTFEYGEPLGHDYSYDYADWQYIVSEATCTEPAIYRCVCMNCWEAGHETFAYGEPRGHIFDRAFEDIASKVPGEDGLYYYSCECGELGTDTFKGSDFGGTVDPDDTKPDQSTNTPTGSDPANTNKPVEPAPAFTTAAPATATPTTAATGTSTGTGTTAKSTTAVTTDTETGTATFVVTSTDGSNINISIEGCSGSLGVAPIAIIVVLLCGFALTLSRRKEN